MMIDYKHIDLGTYKQRQQAETLADMVLGMSGLFVAFGGLFIVLNLGV